MQAAVMHQAEIAAAKVAASDQRGKAHQPRAANATKPALPIVAPAASAPAASAARFSPPRPASLFRSRSRLSISVTLAGKIAGKARNRPPAAGPQRLPIAPAQAVITPPSTNRSA